MDQGYGFLTVRVGLKPEEVKSDIFLHMSELSIDAKPVDQHQFAQVKTKEEILEFSLVEQKDGRIKAVDAYLFRP